MRYLVVEVVGRSVPIAIPLVLILVVSVPLVCRWLSGVQLIAVLGGVLLSLGLRKE